VQRVKEVQRISKGHRAAWDRYCREAGSSKLDPGIKDDDYLQQFLDAVEMGMISTDFEEAPHGNKGGGGQGYDGAEEPSEELVQAVKEWQRRSKGHKQAWDRFVKEAGADKSLDPKSKDDGFLQQFLDATEQGLISTEYHEDQWKGKGKDGTKGGGGKGYGADPYGADASRWNHVDGDRDEMLSYLSTGMAVMIEKGKGKFGKGFMKLIDQKGFGKGIVDVREPSGGKGYDFREPSGGKGYNLREPSGGKGYDFREPSGGKGYGGADARRPVGGESDLVQRVKDWQRMSKGHKQAWDRFCEDAGHTKLDPKTKDEDFLYQFLDATEQGMISTDFDEDEWNARNAGKGKKGGGSKGMDGPRYGEGNGPMVRAPPAGKGKATVAYGGGYGKGPRSSPY